MSASLPLGKLPFELLSGLLDRAPIKDPRVMYGPGIGLDCAVINLGERLLVFKSDPITFATEDIGWYLVQINANDVATTGATPRWMLATLLLPENDASPERVEGIFDQIYRAAQALGISVVGGHTEVTFDIRRPLVSGTLIGEVERDRLITPDHVVPGDRLLLTKGVPIEGTALLAREFPGRLRSILTDDELTQAQDFLYSPGISVVRDAQIAVNSGRVHAMHDPTEGGLASAIWELATAARRRMVFDADFVPVPNLSRRICAAFELNPLATIASGALLLAVDASDALAIRRALEADGIQCSDIGWVEDGPVSVVEPGGRLVRRPERDEIARVYEST